MRGGGWWAARGREYRSTWRGRLGSLLLLVPTLWLSVLLLRVPAGGALTVPALLIDRVVVVSAAVVLPAAVLLLLVLPLRGARVAAAVGGVVSGVVGLPTALAALDAPREVLPTALALTSVLCGAALGAALLSSSLRGRRWSLSVLAPLSVLPAIQFWQATSYTPSQLITSVTPEVHVVAQRVDDDERLGVFDVTLANNGDVRASLLTSMLTYCFVTEDDWELEELVPAELRADDGNCASASVVIRGAQVDAHTTQTYSIPWMAPRDRSSAIVALESYDVREDRVRLEDTPEDRAAGEGCQGRVTTYRLQPDTRFEGVVQPTRLLTYDANTFHLGYEDAPLPCDVRSDSELLTELGVRITTIRRSDWLTDSPAPG